jgi:hypothetical protein
VKDFDVQHNQNHGSSQEHGTVLLHSRLPCQLFGSPLKVLGLHFELVTNVGNMIELFSAVQNLVNVLFHNGLNLGQVLVQSGIVFVLVLIPKFSLLSLNNRIVMYKLKGSSRLVNRFAPLWLSLREKEKERETKLTHVRVRRREPRTEDSTPV